MYDERETLFSRINLEKGTKEYNEFYSKHKDLKDKDDSLRRISFRHVLRKSDQFKDLFFPLTTNNKLYIKSLHDMAVNYEVKEKLEIPKGFSKNIKEITKYYGATDVGIVKLDEFSYYSHSGGLNESLGIYNYNEKIKPKYKTAIVFTVKMDLEFINRAPHFEELLTTEQAYLRVAEISARLTLYLKSIGYDSFANNSEIYLAPLVPLAYDAGLGEIGMSNHLITLEHGDNVRLGAVFTNIELEVDKPIDFGLTDFCKQCALCLINCPSKAQLNSTPNLSGAYSKEIQKQTHRFWEGKLQFDYARCCDDRGQMASLFPEWSCAGCLTICAAIGNRRKNSSNNFYKKMRQLTNTEISAN